MSARTALSILLAASTVLAQPPEMAFKESKPGEFTFDTGRFSGCLVASENGQGVLSLVDKASGVELTKGNPQYGIFSLYRLLSPDQRWGGVVWEWPKSAVLLPDGGVRITWPAEAEHPAELAGTFRWSAPDTLDLQIEIKPQKDMPGVELFIGSYFKKNARGFMYVAPARYGSGKPELVPVDFSPLTVGTYLAFPRDLQAAQMVYDGRWELGLHPVQWSISRYMAAPLAVRHDPQTDTSMVLMSRLQDCFAMYCSYNQDPPDGVANHYSTYSSMFGRDLKAGDTARALARLVIVRGLDPDRAIELHERFASEHR